MNNGKGLREGSGELIDAYRNQPTDFLLNLKARAEAEGCLALYSSNIEAIDKVISLRFQEKIREQTQGFSDSIYKITAQESEQEDIEKCPTDGNCGIECTNRCAN